MFFLSSIFFLAIFKQSGGVSLSGCVDTPMELYYVARFGFGPDGGQLSFEIEWPTDFEEHPKYAIALLTASQHIATRLDSLSCQQKISKSRMIRADNYSVGTADDVQFTKCEGQQTLNDESFIYLTDCRSGAGRFHDVTYSIILRNEGKPLRREFSADEMYVLETSIAALMVYIVMLTVATWMLVKVFRTKLKIMYRWYFASICSQTCAALILTIALACFSQTGRGLPHLLGFGHAFSCFSIPVFSALLIVIGKGHSVTRRNISVADNMRVGTFMIASAAANLISKLSPFSYDDVYDFPDQYKVIMIINGIGAMWFFTSVYHTLQQRPKLASFFVPFLIFYLVWFLAEPIFLLIAFYGIPLLETPNVLNGVYWTVSIIGHASFFIIIRPSGLKERFPYCMAVNEDDMSSKESGSIEQKSRSQSLQVDMETDIKDFESLEQISLSLSL